MIQAIINELPFSNLKEKTHFKGISIDTRTLQKGNIFVCIMGDNFDGTDFIDEAIKKGCVAIISQKEITAVVPVIVVKNTRQALQKISGWWVDKVRKKSQAKFIAITGSNGKTTTKEMLKAILEIEAKTLATKGNLNNDLGVPLTLCQLSPKDKYAVIEIGANHLDEIKPLVELVQPNIAVVTNVFESHLGEFGCLKNIVKTKAQIYQTLTKNDIAIIDNNTPYKNFFLENTQAKTYFIHQDIKAKKIKNNSFELVYEEKNITIHLKLLGSHQIENALVAGLIALKLGFSLMQVKQGLENCVSPKGRLNELKIENITFIDDSYNASPTSCKKALEVLKNYSNNKIAVLGSMGELGEKSQNFHTEIGNFARKMGIETLLSLGDEAKNYQGLHFSTHEEIALYLIDHIHKPTTILIKGSRFMKMEKVIDYYLSLKQATNCCND